MKETGYSDLPTEIRKELAEVAFSDNPLIDYKLIELDNSRFRIPDKIIGFLLGFPAKTDDAIRHYTESMLPPRRIPDSFKALVQNISEILRASNGDSRTIIEINAEQFSYMSETVSLACRDAELNLRRIKFKDIYRDYGSPHVFTAIWNRDTRMDDLVAFIQINDTEQHQWKGDIVSFIERLEGPIVIAATDPFEDHELSTFRIELLEISIEDQELLWKDSMGELAEEFETRISQITNYFHLSSTEIDRIVQSVQLTSGFSGEDKEGSWEKVREEAKKRSRPRILNLAQLIEPEAGLNELILPDSQKEKLNEMINRLKLKRSVLHEWGYGKKLNRGLGVTALFEGKSGTGKTFAAEAIAREAGVDLYRVDLSRVVSKYIGETEKNLRRVFDSARSGSSLLLFDEADALFGKRSEVKDSHDRYANMEIAFLLQKMEEYPGLSILTTNLNENLDEAFRRRIAYHLHFQFPEEDARQEIWKRIFSKETETENLNYEELATLEVTGGEIKNMAIRAVFFARAENSPVKMKHIYHTIKDEINKSRDPDRMLPNMAAYKHWLKDD